MANDNDNAVVVKVRKSPDLKDKKLIFKLQKEIRLADLVKKDGYQRTEVEALFAELEANGLGEYIPGSLGRGKSAKFVCNDGFPENYEITVQVRRLRKEYAGKPQIVEAAPPPAPAPADAPVESVIMPAEQSVLCADAPAPVDPQPLPGQTEIDEEIIDATVQETV